MPIKHPPRRREAHGLKGELSRRQFLMAAAATPAAIQVARETPVDSRSPIEYIRQTPADVSVPEYRGTSYEDRVPDTLDLADRARLAINPLISCVDPNDHYNQYLKVQYAADPPYMWHMDIGDFLCCNPKWAESLPLLRVMSGSNQGLDVEQKLMHAMVEMIDPDDGLCYLPPEPLSAKPWYKRGNYAIATEPIASPYGNARLMLAMLAWYQRDRDKTWLDKIGKMARGLAKTALLKDDYAYYPEGKVGMEFAYLKYSGYNYKDEAQSENEGGEGSMFVYHSGPIRALTRWYRFSGDRQALETATRLVKFVTKPRFWGISGTPADISPSEHAYFTGHMHGHTMMLYALIEYAVVTENSELMNFVRDGYEFARHHGIPRLGAWLNNQPDVEVCTISDMIATAIKLTEAGLGDFYEDVDQAVRNQLVESQLVRADFLREISQAAPAYVAQQPQETSDRVIERTIGILAPLPIGGYEKPYAIGCCTGNGTQALYYVWSKIIEPRGEAVQINLLLNRTSPDMDIDSYLPNEGKVVLHNKKAKRAYVRIPHFVDRKSVKVSAPRGRLDVYWVNRYVVLPHIRPNEEIQITFPIREESATYTFHGAPYVCTFRGNTAVDISPRVSRPGYPIYLREQDRQERAALVNKPRYVSTQTIDW